MNSADLSLNAHTAHTHARARLFSEHAGRDQVMQLMLQAQRWDATDADAHVVLGVLYNVSRDYDSAAEAFRRAIEARPGDHSLWNKVGGMLAGAGAGRSGGGRGRWWWGSFACLRVAMVRPCLLRSWFRLGRRVFRFSLILFAARKMRAERGRGSTVGRGSLWLPLYPHPWLTRRREWWLQQSPRPLLAMRRVLRASFRKVLLVG